MKLCECGCGRPAPIAQYNCKRDGMVKGQPCRFVRGHGGARTGGPLKHGMRYSKEYNSFAGAKQRCTNKNHPRWADYGGRGIQFNFATFEEFFAEVGFRPSPKHTIDRINNDGHYEAGNIRWSTKKEQAQNARPRRKRQPNGEMGDVYVSDITKHARRIK